MLYRYRIGEVIAQLLQTCNFSETNAVKVKHPQLPKVNMH